MRSEIDLVRLTAMMGMASVGHDEARKKLPREFRGMSGEELAAAMKALEWAIEGGRDG